MEFQTVVRRRRMMRRFDPDRAVPRQVLDAVLDNAVRAPSAGFSQGSAFLVLSDPTDIARFRETVRLRDRPWYTRAFHLSETIEAPALVICWSNRDVYLDHYAEPGSDSRDDSWWPAPYWDIDTGFAALLMMLTAVDQELGACFFGIAPDRVQALRDLFGVPDDFSPIGALAVGYPPPDPSPDDIPTLIPRRPREELVHHGRWGGPVAGRD